MGRGMGMGRGAANFPYPKWVWSPAGGWWCEPKNGPRNTMIAAGIWGVILYLGARFSSANERRIHAPHDAAYPIPSQYWCKHAVEDDPRLQAMGWASPKRASNAIFKVRVWATTTLTAASAAPFD